MMKTAFILLLYVPCMAEMTFAQHPFQLSGKVTDSAGLGLSHTTVLLIIMHDTLTHDTLHTLTGGDGVFVFDHVTGRKFDVRISMKGYLPYVRSYDLSDDKNKIRLPPIVLTTDFTELEAVTVTGVRPISVNGDTVSYNSAAFPVPPFSKVEDVLKRLPGVMVDKDGNVVVNGKIVRRVLVNGEEFFGGDVLLAIRNLPAEVISKLQFIDDYGDKARLTGVRSGSPAKVMNLVTKDKLIGGFGNVIAGSGTTGKYTAKTLLNLVRGKRQLSLNGEVSDNSETGTNISRSGGFHYIDRWFPHLTTGLNGNTTGNDTRSSIGTIQDTYNPGQQLHQEQRNQNEGHSKNYNLFGSFYFKPDDHSTLHMEVNGNERKSSTQTAGTFTTKEQDSGFLKTTTGSSLNKNLSSGQGLRSSVYYDKSTVDDKDRFSITSNFNYSGALQTSDNQSNAAIVTDTSSSQSLLHYLIDNRNSNWGGDVAFTYYKIIKAGSFLELGYTGQMDRSQTSVRTQDAGTMGGPPVIIDSLSNVQLFKNSLQGIHIGYSGSLRHKVDLGLGLDGQRGLMAGDVDTKGDVTSFHYFSVLPKVQASWQVNKNQRINFGYNGIRNLPSLQQLMPFTDLTNPQSPVTGNPDLKPSFTHSGSLHYNLSSIQAKRYFEVMAGLGFSSTGHTIISNIVHPKDSSQVVQRTTYLNAGTTSAVNADFAITLPALFDNWLRIFTAGGFTSSRTITMTDGFLYTNQNQSFNESLNCMLSIPKLGLTGLNGSYNITETSYPGQGSLPGRFQAASVTLFGQYSLFHNVFLNYQWSQSYNNSGAGFVTAPASLSGTLGFNSLLHGKIMISISGSNLLNSNAATVQVATATGTTQTSTKYAGRYFFCTVEFNVDQFRK